MPRIVPSGSPEPIVPAVPKLLTMQEAATVLRVSKWTLNRLIQEGQLVSLKIGARRLVPAAELDAFIAQAQQLVSAHMPRRTYTTF